MVSGSGFKIQIWFSSKQAEHKSPVIIENGVESVSNGEHSAALELSPDGLLDMIVCGHVHGRRSFVQHQNAGLPEQRSGQADQLALTNTGRKYIMYLKCYECLLRYDWALSLLEGVESGVIG